MYEVAFCEGLFAERKFLIEQVSLFDEYREMMRIHEYEIRETLFNNC